jgi:hypothetical protein
MKQYLELFGQGPLTSASDILFKRKPGSEGLPLE